MNLFNLIGNIFKPAADLIDNLHTSEEEKLEQKIRMMEVERAVMSQALEFETKRLEAQSAIIEAEAKSSNWLVSSWRPITMLTFLGMVVLDSFGVLPNKLAPEAWLLLQIGLGGYVADRSGEKIVKMLKDK